MMPEDKWSRAEIVKRGEAIYHERIRPLVEAAHPGEFLALDVVSGEYEIDADELVALRRAKSRRADAVLYLLRIGHPTAYRLGAAIRAATL